MEFTDLPQEILSRVLEELPINHLSPFLQSRFTCREAYRQIHSKKSVKIRTGSPSFHENHFNFGLYAHEENDADYYGRSSLDLKYMGNRTVMKRSLKIYLEADLTNIDFPMAVIEMADLLRISCPKIMQVHTIASSQASLELILLEVERLSNIPTIKVSLKLEIEASLIPLLFQRIENIPIISLNIFVLNTRGPLDLGCILLRLHPSTQRFKLKSVSKFLNLFICGESLSWLDIDMPMTESMGFLQNLHHYNNLTELRLFQIDNSFNKDYFFDLVYPPTLKNLYLHFGNEANAFSVAHIQRDNPHIEYLYISDNKRTITYRK